VKNITIRFGARETTVELDDEGTVDDVLKEAAVKRQLRFGENVDALIEGVAVDTDHEPDDGDTIVLETRAAQKAA
jgi:hypothetical protein